MGIEYACYSNVGNVRDNNEDSAFINGKYKVDIEQPNFKANGKCQSQGVFAVFDGMGGEEVGEMASYIAAKTLFGFDINELFIDPLAYMNTANEIICNECMKSATSIGTTAAILIIKDEGAVIANIGDSRIYHFKNNEMIQLSKDHTQVQQLLELGVLTEEESRTHTWKHILTQHLGIRPSDYIIEPYVLKNISIDCGDIFLLCSDGLTDMLADSEIMKVLQQNEKTNAVAEKLVNDALEVGGKDNITVLVVKIQMD